MSKEVLKNFIITIKNGKPSFTSDEQRFVFYKFLKQFEGKKVWMTIDPKLPKRSDRQNRFYWLYLGIIARETGYDVEELHIMLKERFLFQDEVIVLGAIVRRTKSTTELSKGEFADYLIQIEQLTDVPVPDTSMFELGLTHEEFNRHRM